MNAPLNFFAILSKKDEDLLIKRISLQTAVQNELTNNIVKKSENWKSLTEVNFVSGYMLNPEEIFSTNINLDTQFKTIINEPNSVEAMSNQDELSSIRGIFSGKQTNEHYSIFFQNFDRRRVLSRSKFNLLLDGCTFTRIQKNIFIYPEDLSIVFDSSNKKCLFKSFHNVNKIIDISHLYREASDSEIQNFLGSEKLLCENISNVLGKIDPSSKKKIGSIIDRKILNKISPKKIQNVCKKYGFHLNIKDNKIIVPKTKKKFQKFIRFLNEDYFESILTKTKYETNSKIKMN